MFTFTQTKHFKHVPNLPSKWYSMDMSAVCPCSNRATWLFHRVSICVFSFFRATRASHWNTWTWILKYKLRKVSKHAVLNCDTARSNAIVPISGGLTQVIWVLTILPLARSSSHKIQETVTPWSRYLFICVYFHLFSFSVCNSYVFIFGFVPNLNPPVHPRAAPPLEALCQTRSDHKPLPKPPVYPASLDKPT